MLFAYDVHAVTLRVITSTTDPAKAHRGLPRVFSAWVIAVVLGVAGVAIPGAAPAHAALDQVDAGFDLAELVELAGAPDDPGPADPQARLEWAITVAIPPEWRVAVPVRWVLGPAGSRHLALSYVEGRSVVSPRVMQLSAEAALSTVAHEMGHQIAFQAVEPFNGFPPQEFIDRASGMFRDIKEGWADCVARAWTGSTLHTRAELRGCPQELAHRVAALLADPAGLIEDPTPVPSPSRPIGSPEPSPSPSPVPSPIEHPLMSDYLEPSPTSEPQPSVQAADRAPDRVPGGLFVVIALIVAVVVAAGKRLTRVPNDQLVEWASRSPSGDRLLQRLRKKISRDV